MGCDYTGHALRPSSLFDQSPSQISAPDAARVRGRTDMASAISAPTETISQPSSAAALILFSKFYPSFVPAESMIA